MAEISRAVTRRREYARLFTQVVARVEEALANDRSRLDPSASAAMIAVLEGTTRSAAPRGVRLAATAADLHAALLDWQDAVEVRDGRQTREPDEQAKRVPDLADLGVHRAVRRGGDGPRRRARTVAEVVDSFTSRGA